jgi:hypothetical protein
MAATDVAAMTDTIRAEHSRLGGARSCFGFWRGRQIVGGQPRAELWVPVPGARSWQEAVALATASCCYGGRAWSLSDSDKDRVVWGLTNSPRLTRMEQEEVVRRCVLDGRLLGDRQSVIKESMLKQHGLQLIGGRIFDLDLNEVTFSDFIVRIS